MHEFDTRYHSYDFLQEVSGHDFGKSVASLLKTCMPSEKLPVWHRSKYLGLAAGSAQFEITVAEELDIPLSNVSLLDKYFGRHADNIHQNYPDIQLIDSGILTYLESPEETDFSLVTAIGIDYLLTDDRVKEELIKHLPRTLLPGGVVYIGADSNNTMYDLWDEHGFRNIFPGKIFSLLQYNP